MKLIIKEFTELYVYDNNKEFEEHKDEMFSKGFYVNDMVYSNEIVSMVLYAKKFE